MSPMVSLIRNLASSRYADGLVVRTSMWHLLVAQAEVNLGPGPRLEIELDTSKHQFEFTFWEGDFREKSWSRTTPADEGFEVLERFLVKRARWFRKPDQSEPESPSPSSG